MKEALERAFDGVDLGERREDILTRFDALGRLLLETNQSINLTRITDPLEVAYRHFYEAWTVSRDVDLSPGPLIDLGTGAGFPGLPLAILRPDLNWILVDGTQKKIRIVKGFIQELGLENAVALPARGEEYLRKAKCHTIIARAVAPLHRLIPALAPVRTRFQRLLLMKGPSFEEEWERDREIVEEHAFTLEGTLRSELPGDRGVRVLAILRSATDGRSGSGSSGSGKSRPSRS